MLDEQVEQTTIHEDKVESTATTEKEAEVKVSEYIAPSEEEYKKAIQSASSKAKYDILKEMGVKNVDEFKEWKARYDESENKIKTYETEKQDYQNKITKLEEELVVQKSGVSEDMREDALTLAKARVTKDKDLNTALEEVLSKNPTWRTASREALRIGSEKSEVQEDPANKSLHKMFSWIKEK